MPRERRQKDSGTCARAGQAVKALAALYPRLGHSGKTGVATRAPVPAELKGWVSECLARSDGLLRWPPPTGRAPHAHPRVCLPSRCTMVPSCASGKFSTTDHPTGGGSSGSQEASLAGFGFRWDLRASGGKPCRRRTSIQSTGANTRTTASMMAVSTLGTLRSFSAEASNTNARARRTSPPGARAETQPYVLSSHAANRKADIAPQGDSGKSAALGVEVMQPEDGNTGKSGLGTGLLYPGSQGQLQPDLGVPGNSVGEFRYYKMQLGSTGFRLEPVGRQ